MLNKQMLSHGLTGLESMINKLLTLEPDLAQRLGKLEGKVFAVHVSGLGLQCFILPLKSGLMLRAECESEPDFMVTGPPFSLLALSLSSQKDDLFNGKVEINGDVKLGQELFEILKSMDIDWEEHCSLLVGDVAAHQLGNLTRDISGWVRTASVSFREDIEEYVHEEAELVPPTEHIKKYLNDVDRLRNDVDRIEQRILKL